MTFSRRQVLGGLALAPLAAEAALAKTVASGSIGFGGVALRGGVQQNPAERAARPRNTFTKFADMLAAVGDGHIRENARNVTHYDPDIVDMRLPLVTKRRMQIERNYRRLLAESEEHFLSVVKRDGRFCWW